MRSLGFLDKIRLRYAEPQDSDSLFFLFALSVLGLIFLDEDIVILEFIYGLITPFFSYIVLCFVIV